MYSKIHNLVIACGSKYGEIALQLESAGFPRARAVVNNVKKLYEIDDFCAAHYLARNTGHLIKALAFRTGYYEPDFVELVVTGAESRGCGEFSAVMAPETHATEDAHKTMNVVIRNKLGMYVPSSEIELAYISLRSKCGRIANRLKGDALKRFESAVTIYDAAPIFFDLCRDYAEHDVGDIWPGYYDVLALAFNAVEWTIVENGDNRKWMPLAHKLQQMPAIRAVDTAIRMEQETNINAVPLLHFVQQQISLNNFECAAACALAWADELAELRGYVSRETLFGLKRRCE